MRRRLGEPRGRREVSEGWEAKQRWVDERRGVGGEKGVARLFRVSEGKKSNTGEGRGGVFKLPACS